MNIYQRINEVRKKVSYVQKDKVIQGKNFSYKGVTHDVVTANARDALIDNGVITTQSIVESCFVENGATNSKDEKKLIYQAKYDIKFINMDDPQDYISILVEAHSEDSGDKATGKAMSYAMKYALLKVLNLETGENEEGRQEEIRQKQEAKAALTQEQAETIKEMTEKAQADLAKFLLFFKVNKLEEMKQSDYVKAYQMLETKIKGEQK